MIEPERQSGARTGAGVGRPDQADIPRYDSDVGGVWRALFWAASGFNFIIGLLGMLSPASDIDARIIGLLLFAFGIVYMLVARDPVRFAPTLWAGIIAKVGVVALLAPEAFRDGGDAVVMGVLAIDALFAGAFLVFVAARSESV